MTTSLETLVAILDKTIQEKTRLESIVLQLQEKIKDMTTPKLCTLQDLVKEDLNLLPFRPKIQYDPNYIRRKKKGRPMLIH